MHFTYQTPLSEAALMQGDVLERTPALDALLREVHPHYHEHPKNLYFLVLTQTCDLVPRSASAACKAPYIAIAPVRSLDLVVERHLAQFAAAEVQAELPVLGEKARSKASEFLRRLFNNNEPGYFYLDSGDTVLPVDCVAFLNLSIAVRSDLHYATCLAAKRLQLTDTFQAKLGWLVGQLYSRVGTEDYPASRLPGKVTGLLASAAIWVEDAKFSDLETEYGRRFKAGEREPMSKDEISALLRRVPDRKQRVLERTMAVIEEALKDRDPAVALKLSRRLANDAALTTLLK